MPDVLSSPRQFLLNSIARISFGRIESLIVRNGQPVLDPPPRVVREIKFGADSVTRSAHAPKSQIGELFEALKQVGNGIVDLEIRHGLPFRLIVTEGRDD